MGIEMLRNTKTSKKYKYVTYCETDKGVRWRAQLPKWTKLCDTEKEAAKAVDLKLIERGREPVNVLVLK